MLEKQLKEVLELVKDAEAESRQAHGRIKDEPTKDLARAVNNLSRAFRAFLESQKPKAG